MKDVRKTMDDAQQLTLFGGTADPAGAALALLDGAIREHEPTHVFGLFSGGHDSLCATHVAAQHPAFSGVVHVNTGVGIEATRRFVRETCARYGWPLRELHPPAKGYAEFVLEHGFPGPASHRYSYVWLKERALAKLIRETKLHPKDRIVLVTGVRRQESERRMGTVQPVNRDGATVWVAPIIEWTGFDKNRYMAAQGLTRNPVVDLLCMSGECLCGAFAKPGELDYIARFYPEDVAPIRDLERRAAERGVHCRWGEKPAERVPEAQTSFLPLCWSCDAKRERDI